MGLWSAAIRPYPPSTVRRQSAKAQRKAERHLLVVPTPSLPPNRSRSPFGSIGALRCLVVGRAARKTRTRPGFATSVTWNSPPSPRGSRTQTGLAAGDQDGVRSLPPQCDRSRLARDVDMPAVKTLFVYRDRLDRLLATLDDPEVDAAAAARQVRTWQAVISSVSAELGVGPRNRQSLGIQTEVAVGSRLDAFRATAD